MTKTERNTVTQIIKQHDRLVTALKNLVNQNCTAGGKLDSHGLTVNVNAIEVLIDLGLADLESVNDKRVIAKWADGKSDHVALDMWKSRDESIVSVPILTE